ncbi:MAG TPA: hypothetical protein VGQ41_12645 [Pyrinomonadaceae bacterium]|jgi:hypothetical protein|nr:hypothetical protein [Pyrinomonadaceae bacterium]
MKYFIYLVIVCATCITIHAQHHTEKGVLMDAGRDKFHANLQLTPSVISQRYCSDSGLYFTLRFKFINSGGESIILDKRSSIVPRFTVSRNAQDAAAGKHKIMVEYLIGIDGQVLTLNPIPDESQFVILRAGESHVEDHPFSIPAGDKKLKAGSYVLQLSVLTWHYPRASNIQWREKWADRGYLWTDSLRSMPMTFTIPKVLPIEKCS